MLPKSCPRCGGWVMHQTVNVDLIESTCVMCGWVTYRDTQPWERIADLRDGHHTTEKALDKDTERP
jgi:hypothetical protein